MDIQVKNLDHLGIVAGIIDQIGLVEEIDRQVEQHNILYKLLAQVR